MPGKAAKGKKKSSAGSKKKKAEELEAANLARQQQLKEIKSEYSTFCRLFVTEPLPAIVKRIDRAVASEQGFDKLLLASQSVSPNDLHSILQTFRSYNQLNMMCLWRAALETNGFKSLQTFIEDHPAISTLQLIDCQLKPSSGPLLERLCRDCTGIKTIVLDHNPLGAAAISALFNGIHANQQSQVTQISLKYVEAGSECAQSIANCLGGQSQISELDLSGNDLGDSTLLALACQIHSESKLRSLNLSSNQIIGSKVESPETPGTLITPLAIFASSCATEMIALSALDLRGNHFGNSGGECILEMLQNRKQLYARGAATRLCVHVTERIRNDLYESIWELNESMYEVKGKNKKGKSKPK